MIMRALTKADNKRSRASALSAVRNGASERSYFDWELQSTITYVWTNAGIVRRCLSNANDAVVTSSLLKRGAA